ncbi:Vacuolar protein sorting-associated protein 52-like protein, partial [Ophiophagus hannah]
GQSDEALPLNLGELDLTSEEFILDEVDIHIQANLEDALVQEALKTAPQILRRARTLPPCTPRSRPAMPSWSTILETPVTDQAFLEQLHELNNKINAVKEQAFRETMACTDVADILDKLKAKAVAKIRDFILQKVVSFRKPMTNYQIPQNALLKYRFFYQFLLGHERVIAKEVRDDYVDTMSKIYLSYFKSYTNRLMKLQPSLRSRNTIFTLGNRGNVISSAELEGPIIVPHSAQKSDVRKHMDAYVSDCYDSIAVFLCIHIVLRFKALVAKRNVPAIDK